MFAVLTQRGKHRPSTHTSNKFLCFFISNTQVPKSWVECHAYLFYSYLLITCIAHPIYMQGLTFHVVAAADDVSWVLKSPACHLIHIQQFSWSHTATTETSFLTSHMVDEIELLHRILVCTIMAGSLYDILVCTIMAGSLYDSLHSFSTNQIM
jgi:hypothetical protein